MEYSTLFGYLAVGVGMIGTLLGIFRSIVKPMLELKTVLVSLDETVKMLKNSLNTMNESNEREHNLLFKETRSLDNRITRIETECDIRNEKRRV